MHVHRRRPPLIDHLEDLVPVDGLVHGLPDFFLGPGDGGVQFAIGATVLRVAPRLRVLSAKIQPPEYEVDLLCRPSARDHLIALADGVVDQVFIDLRKVGLACQHLRIARRLLNGPGHLELFPIHHPVLPVGRRGPLEQDVAIHLALFDHVGTRAGRMRLIPHLPLFVPLRFAKHGHVRSARVVKQHVETHIFTVHDELMVVEHFNAMDHAHAVAVAREGRILTARVVVVAPQGVVVHHILGGELAIAVLKRHAFVQRQVPGPAVLRHLPALGQPGLVLALWTDLEEPFKGRIMLDHVVRGAIDPRTPVVSIGQNQPHHQTVHLGLPGDCRSLDLRSPQPQGQQ